MKTNSQKIIGFDLDGVIVDHSQLKKDLLQEWGFAVDLKETHTMLIKTVVPKEIYSNLQQLIYDDPIIGLKPVLMPGIIEVLYNLQKKSLPFYLISRRYNPDLAIRLLKIHELWPKYFNETNTNFVATKSDKNIVASRLGVTHFIDDDIICLGELVCVKHRYFFDPLGSYSKSHSYVKLATWQDLTIL